MTGRVAIVGGGPGAPDLITVRGRERLLAADLVIVDRLAPRELLADLGSHVEIVDASRTPEGRAIPQSEINRLLVQGALAGRAVVRLKGGDPFVLAHGLEEVQACTHAGVSVEVVPGVSSATAAPALAGIALTERDGAQGFTVVSGHVPPGHPDSRVDWTALAHSGATLVLLMAVRNLGAIASALIAAGLDAASDAFAVADASLPAQRAVSAPLSGLAGALDAAQLSNPAVIVIHPRLVSARTTLVLGGSRSGKSGFAESLLVDEPAVDYLATSLRSAEDAEWAERVRLHRSRRPATWRTVETLAAAELLQRPESAVLLDSVTSWLAGVMDESGFWQGNSIQTHLDELISSWAAPGRRVVAVSDEVGSGIVPATDSGRAFRDALGALNQRLAAAADEVWLVTAGIPKRLK